MPYLPLKMLSPLFLIQKYNQVVGLLNFWDGRFYCPKENFSTLHVFPSDKKPVLCLCLLFCLSIHLSVRPSDCLSVIRFIWVPFIQIGVCTMYLLTLTEASPADHLLFSLTCVYVPSTCILQVSVFVCCKKKVSFSFINFKYHFNSQ